MSICKHCGAVTYYGYRGPCYQCGYFLRQEYGVRGGGALDSYWAYEDDIEREE